MAAQMSDMPQVWPLSSTLNVKQWGRLGGLVFERENEDILFLLHLTWNNLYKLMPEISAALDDPLDSYKQWHLQPYLLIVCLDRHKGQTCLQLSFTDNDLQKCGLRVTMDEWKTLVTFADDIDTTLEHHVVEQCVLYIVLKRIEKIKKEKGCLMQWTDAVFHYWKEALKYITPFIVRRIYYKLREKLGKPDDPNPGIRNAEIEKILADFNPKKTILLPNQTVHYLNNIYEGDYMRYE